MTALSLVGASIHIQKVVTGRLRNTTGLKDLHSKPGLWRKQLGTDLRGRAAGVSRHILPSYVQSDASPTEGAFPETQVCGRARDPATRCCATRLDLENVSWQFSLPAGMEGCVEPLLPGPGVQQIIHFHESSRTSALCSSTCSMRPYTPLLSIHRRMCYS